MILVLSILLFLGTLIGGSIPFWLKKWNPASIKYLLAFSGSFFLGITLLHLIPEAIIHYNNTAGMLIVGGFLLQLIFQRITHGIEHGHVHLNQSNHHHSVSLVPLYIGLGIHAFSEGIPLGMPVFEGGVQSSLFVAILFHKLPEAMLIASVIMHQAYPKKKAYSLFITFCAITPVAVLMTNYFSESNALIKNIIGWCLPVIAGSFLHIATTIFYESGTQKHQMNKKNWFAIFLGIGIALLSILFTGHQH